MPDSPSASAALPPGRFSQSLRLRLGLGAAALGLGVLAGAALLYMGMTDVAGRLEQASAADQRLARYSVISQQVSTFLVIATEAVQTSLPAAERNARVQPISDRIAETFTLLHRDVAAAVAAAEQAGIDTQSRFGSQSLGLARMEALMANATRALGRDIADQPRLRAHLDTFASAFDPLLAEAVNTEILFRNQALASIDDLRERLALTALVLGGLAMVGVAGFYLGLVRPQFARLDRLRGAAQRIGAEDFSFQLPDTRADEIGAIYAETNRMAGALAARQVQVATEWTRLNQTIADRTAELSAANARLAEIDENRRRFFADVSHELRTPLTVILTEAQIGETTKDASAFGVIRARAQRMNRRIDDLLRVARSDSGQLQLDPSALPLPRLIEDVTAETAGELNARGMRLSLGPVPDVHVWADSNWIRQILVGLIRNALRHARDGEALHLAVDVTGGSVAIALTDNGPGIAPAEQPRIFDRFAQGKTSSESQGFGIGLALAQWVVQDSGGTIAVQSPVSRDAALGAAPGTRVTLHLPLYDGP